jgi:hypothetical protein
VALDSESEEKAPVAEALVETMNKAVRKERIGTTHRG